MTWILVLIIATLILPTVLGWVPAILEFLFNFVLWLIWVLRYRGNK